MKRTSTYVLILSDNVKIKSLNLTKNVYSKFQKLDVESILIQRYCYEMKFDQNKLKH